MAVTAADVPAKYDVVFVGVPNVSDFGCVYADSVEPSLPFRTHRAIYDKTPTFIERQNIGGSWGDDQQDFFMTQSQNDWSLGAGQRYFNDPTDLTQKRKFWSCLRAEINVAGEIALAARAYQHAFIAPSSIVSDGTFESDTLGVLPSGWLADTSYTLVADATHVHSGSKAAKATCIAGTNWICGCPQIGDVSGVVYAVSFWFYVPSSFAGSALSISTTSSGSGGVVAAVNLALRDQWQQVTLTFTSAGGNIRLYVRGTTNSSDTFWIDDVTAIEQPTPICGCSGALIYPAKHVSVTLASRYTIDAAGTLTALGAGTTPKQWGICTDGTALRGAGAQTDVAGAIAYLNGFVYTCDGSVLDSWVGPGAGTKVTIYTWKDSSGSALTPLARHPKLIPFGGKILIWWPQLFDRPELWQYDGTATNVQMTLPPSVIGYDILESEGLVYLSGLASASQGGSSGAKPTIWMWDGNTISKIYESPYVVTASAINIAAMPALGTYQGDLVFTDPAQANGPYATPMLMRYVLATGAIYPLDAYTVSSLTGTFTPFITSTETSILLSHDDTATNQALYPFDYTGAAQLDTSLFTFDSSLTKLLRGVTIDWTGDTAPNVSYQIGTVDGSYTALATGVASGVETAFPANTTGRSVSIRVTIPSGTTKIKRIMVRAAPELTSFKRGVYILDCTGTTDRPRQLRDGTPAPLTGYETVQNLLAAAASKTPFTVTDKINGTYTGLVDLQDPEGWDVYEVHPYTDDKKRPGCYLVRVTVREV